jgi:hypothetical protein
VLVKPDPTGGEGDVEQFELRPGPGIREVISMVPVGELEPDATYGEAVAPSALEGDDAHGVGLPEAPLIPGRVGPGTEAGIAG